MKAIVAMLAPAVIAVALMYGVIVGLVVIGSAGAKSVRWASRKLRGRA